MLPEDVLAAHLQARAEPEVVRVLDERPVADAVIKPRRPRRLEKFRASGEPLRVVEPIIVGRAALGVDLDGRGLGGQVHPQRVLGERPQPGLRHDPVVGHRLVALHDAEGHVHPLRRAVGQREAHVDRHHDLVLALQRDGGRPPVAAALLREIGDGIIEAARHVRELLEVPVQPEAAHVLGERLQVIGIGVLECAPVIVFVEPPVAQRIGDHVAHHVDEHGSARISGDAIRRIRREPIGWRVEALEDTVVLRANDRQRIALMRRVVDAAHVGDAFPRGVRGEAFVHPGVVGLVGAERRVKPFVGGFVGRDAQERAGRALARQEVDHGILHAAIAGLRDGELRVQVGAVFVAEELDELRHPLIHRLPAVFDVAFVQQVVHGAIARIDALVDVIGVGGPGEVVDVLGPEAPRQRVGRGVVPVAGAVGARAVQRVSVTDLVGVLQHTGRPDGVICG